MKMDVYLVCIRATLDEHFLFRIEWICVSKCHRQSELWNRCRVLERAHARFATIFNLNNFAVLHFYCPHFREFLDSSSSWLRINLFQRKRTRFHKPTNRPVQWQNDFHFRLSLKKTQQKPKVRTEQAMAGEKTRNKFPSHFVSFHINVFKLKSKEVQLPWLFRLRRWHKRWSYSEKLCTKILTLPFRIVACALALSLERTDGQQKSTHAHSRQHIHFQKIDIAGWLWIFPHWNMPAKNRQHRPSNRIFY